MPGLSPPASECLACVHWGAQRSEVTSLSSRPCCYEKHFQNVNREYEICLWQPTGPSGISAAPPAARFRPSVRSFVPAAQRRPKVRRPVIGERSGPWGSRASTWDPHAGERTHLPYQPLGRFPCMEAGATLGGRRQPGGWGMVPSQPIISEPAPSDHACPAVAPAAWDDGQCLALAALVCTIRARGLPKVCSRKHTVTPELGDLRARRTRAHCAVSHAKRDRHRAMRDRPCMPPGARRPERVPPSCSGRRGPRGNNAPWSAHASCVPWRPQGASQKDGTVLGPACASKEAAPGPRFKGHEVVWKHELGGGRGRGLPTDGVAARRMDCAATAQPRILGAVGGIKMQQNDGALLPPAWRVAGAPRRAWRGCSFMAWAGVCA